MGVIAILGAQWGDEGKGKLSRLISQGTDVCARYQGGANAGHTVVLDTNEEFVFRQVPCGILDAHCGILAGGMALNPIKLVAEIEALQQVFDSNINKRLFIAKSTHLVTPAYVQEETSSAVSKQVGTTGNGIGPTYREKSRRTGVRVEDLMSGDVWHAYWGTAEEREAINKFKGLFGCSVVDGADFIRSALSEGKTVVAEGGQGALLDIDHGDYPFVTSSNTTIGGVLTGLGVGPKDISKIYMVAACYMTKVGGGAFSTRMKSDLEQLYQTEGREIDGATSKLRHCGWLNLESLRRACEINQPDSLVLTRLDVAAAVGRYYVQPDHLDDPISISTEGWADWFHSPDLGRIPLGIKKLIDKIEEAVNVRVEVLSFGRDGESVAWL